MKQTSLSIRHPGKAGHYNNDSAIFERAIMKRQTKDHKLSSLQRETSKSSRRKFLSQSGKVLAGSVLAGVALNRIHAGEDNTIRLALVGCGGRGSGAAGNALSSTAGPTKLVAMADVFEDKQARSYKAMSE